MNTDLQLGLTTSRDIPRRHHSKQLVETLGAWDPFLERPGQSHANHFRDFPIESLNNIIAEASFLGFPQTVKLARAVRLAILRSTERPTYTEASRRRLTQAIETLRQAVRNDPNRVLGQPIELLRELQSDFSLTDFDLMSPLEIEMKALPTELTTGFNGNQSFAEHRDLDVYRNSRLDSLDQCFEEESWIVSQLASLAEDLASGTHCSHPAARLLYVLKNHKLFNQVDRLCLVGRVAGANQLVVVDASMSDRCPENSLKKGYSCFVNPDGSLFKMKPGTVRMFGDCERVLSSFAAQGKPAQRSIALISDLGLRSGLCLAFGRNSEVQGFLFLNSVQEDLFREISLNSAPILSLFGLIATITLDTNGFHPLPKNHPLRSDVVPKSSNVFELNRFKKQLEQSLEIRCRPGHQPTIEISPHEESMRFLYLPTTIINSLAELISRINDGNQAVRIDVSITLGQVQIGFDHYVPSTDMRGLTWLSQVVQSIDVEFANKPVSIKKTESKIVVEFPFEPVPASHQSLLYSTVC